MKLKSLIILLMLYGLSFNSFAESDIQTSPTATMKAKQLIENEKNATETTTPIPPITPRTPNFSLQGLKPANSAPLAELQLTSAILTNSDLADTRSSSTANAMVTRRSNPTTRRPGLISSHRRPRSEANSNPKQ
jgi:hypothetical protein